MRFWIHIAIILIILAVLALFNFKIRLFLFALLASFSLLHNRITQNYIGFELCTLLTVIATLKYGFATGIFVALFSFGLGLIFGTEPEPGILICLLASLLIVIVSSFFDSKDLLVAGMLSTLVYDLVISTFYYSTGSNPFTILSFSVTHLLLNFLIFKSLGSFFFSLI